MCCSSWKRREAGPGQGRGLSPAERRGLLELRDGGAAPRLGPRRADSDSSQSRWARSSTPPGGDPPALRGRTFRRCPPRLHAPRLLTRARRRWPPVGWRRGEIRAHRPCAGAGRGIEPCTARRSQGREVSDTELLPVESDPDKPWPLIAPGLQTGTLLDLGREGFARGGKLSMPPQRGRGSRPGGVMDRARRTLAGSESAERGPCRGAARSPRSSSRPRLPHGGNPSRGPTGRASRATSPGAFAPPSRSPPGAGG